MGAGAPVLLNARDAMPTGGRLVIACRNIEITHPIAVDDGDLPPGRYVEVAVSDTGQGIPPEVRPRVFEPFFTTKETGKGTGLGLSMVYGFARQSGGLATIASEAGVGTTVAMLFPISAREAPPRSRRQAAAVARGQRGATVLVTEDDETVREIVQRSLSEHGCRVLVANDGPQAVSLLDRHGAEIDLLLSDVVMPNGMSGVDLAREARRRKPEMRVLLTSGYAGEELSKHGGLGQFELLPKPFRPAELMERVQDVLGWKA
jgi:CheY-like chemotaxis protein